MNREEILEMVASEFGFSFDYNRYSRDAYVIKRSSKNPNFKTEYIFMTLVDDIIDIFTTTEHIYISINDPHMHQKLAHAFETIKYLGSHGFHTNPLGCTRIF